MYTNKKKIVEIKNIYFDASVKFNISLGEKGRCSTLAVNQKAS